MKKTMKIILSACFALFLGNAAMAQDVIVLKNGEKISCTIKELSDSQVKYIEIEDANELLFTLNRGQVREIKFAYGKVIEEQPDGVNEAYYTDDNRSNLKLNFLAIGADAFILTYERAINHYSSWEVTPKIIGIGFNDNIDDSGFALDFGYKIKLKSISNKNDYRPDHLMHGSYLRIASGIGFTSSETFFSTRSANIIHFGLDLGKQWIIQNRIALDLYAGIHYYGGSFERTYNGQTDIYSDESFTHGDLGGSEKIAASFGLRIGVLFEKMGTQSTKNTRSR